MTIFFCLYHLPSHHHSVKQTSYKIVTHILKSYPIPNLVTPRMNFNKPAAVTLSFPEPFLCQGSPPQVPPKTTMEKYHYSISNVLVFFGRAFFMEIDRTALRDDRKRDERDGMTRHKGRTRTLYGTHAPTELPGCHIVTPSRVECRLR